MIRNSLPKDCEAIYDMVCDMEQTKLDREAFEKIYHEQRNNRITPAWSMNEMGKRQVS